VKHLLLLLILCITSQAQALPQASELFHARSKILGINYPQGLPLDVVPQTWLQVQPPSQNQLPSFVSTAAGASEKVKLGQDFLFMQSLRGGSASRLHSQVFGALDGKTYLAFMEQRVASLSPFDCWGNAAALGCAVHKYVFLTENYFRRNIPQVVRVSILLHESRHAESSAGWPHATCPEPFLDKDGHDIVAPITQTPLAGKDACDTEALGAYGVGVIMLKNIEKNCSSCNGKIKLDAALFAEDGFGRIIDRQALETLREDLK